MFASSPERTALAAELATAIRPTAQAATRLVPVVEPLRALLPDGALRRGSTVLVAGAAGLGATTLALSLLADASASGHWCAAIGLDDPGIAAMAELGVDLARCVFVPRPRGAWAVATAELVEGVDVVLVRPPARVAHTAARRLAGRVRDRASILIVLVEHREDWPVPVALDVEVVASTWRVDGRLVTRRAEVRATGRGITGRPRRAALWLPDAGGAVAAAG
jgi:type IV secretory pathway protease TraF